MSLPSAAEIARLSGLFLIDKPVGISSFGVLEELKRSLARELGVKPRAVPKLGHGGTLDPFATGLLVVCFNEGVKLSRYYLDSRKRYLASVRFGETTQSGDFTNEVTERTDLVPASAEAIRVAADAFRARPYDQIPPMHSAKKVEGETLYKLARRGIEVERKPKRCEIFRLDVLGYSPETRTAEIDCEVSAGTYIRTLAQDLAREMGSLAALSALRRTRSGSFTVERATAPEDFLSLRGYVPMNACLPHLPRVPVTGDEARALREGRQGGLAAILERTPVVGPIAALYDEKTLLGVAALEDGTWGIERIFARGV